MYAQFNYIGEIQLTKRQAERGSHSGQCDQDIAELRQVPGIRRQLSKINKESLIKELNEYGAWNDAEMKNHDDNLNRILWIACGDISDKIYSK